MKNLAPEQQQTKAIASGVDEKAKAIMLEASYMFPDCRCPPCLSAREVKS